MHKPNDSICPNQRACSRSCQTLAAEVAKAEVAEETKAADRDALQLSDRMIRDQIQRIRIILIGGLQ